MAENVTSTIVGESILISGNLQGDEDLTVLGRVEGTINLTKTLNVEESGIVKANISVRNAVVSGVVVGNITATDSVEITEVGRMVGDIKSPRVIIVDGARYRGAVDMGDLDAPRATGPMPARAADRALAARPSTTTTARAALPAAPARRPVTTTPTSSGGAPIKPTSAPATAPVLAGGKKIKKKVVVKRKGE